MDNTTVTGAISHSMLQRLQESELKKILSAIQTPVLLDICNNIKWFLSFKHNNNCTLHSADFRRHAYAKPEE
jgi:hypothetical protein